MDVSLASKADVLFDNDGHWKQRKRHAIVCLFHFFCSTIFATSFMLFTVMN